MKLSEISRGQLVSLSIPYAAPIRTLDGALHESGQLYKVLGVYAGSFARLSRVSDSHKLIVDPEKLALSPDSKVGDNPLP